MLVLLLVVVAGFHVYPLGFKQAWGPWQLTGAAASVLEVGVGL